MSHLSIRDVSRWYPPDTTAVEKVSLDVDEGEIICLLGPSGCGKTTLLRMIAGLEQPDRGSIWFEGHDMASVPTHRRNFGMMFQEFALFPHKNVYQNVSFGLELDNISPKAIAKRVNEMLQLVELEGFDERDVAQLSGGEQQRVALARALAPGPELLLLDEPLGALDRSLRERLMVDVRSILKRVGVTAVYVTHDQTEAFAVGDRVSVMNQGALEQIGEPVKVYQAPATPFVARFLGFQNLVPGTIDDEGLVQTTIGLFLPSYIGNAGAGDEVTLLIRPEAQIIKAPQDEGNLFEKVNYFMATVDETSFRGRYCQIWLDANGLRLLFEDDVCTLRVGESIMVKVLPSQLQVY